MNNDARLFACRQAILEIASDNISSFSLSISRPYPTDIFVRDCEILWSCSGVNARLEHEKNEEREPLEKVNVETPVTV